MKKMKRIHKCINGHEYESKHPITTEWAEKNIPFNFSIPFIQKKIKANDRCKICGQVIISEICFEGDKLVMGSVRVE